MISDMFSYTGDVVFDLCHNLLDASALHPGCGLRSHIGGYLPLLLVLGVSAEFFLLVILPGVPGVSSFLVRFSFSVFFFSFSFSLYLD